MSKSSTKNIQTSKVERDVLMNKIFSACAEHIVCAYLDQKILHFRSDHRLFSQQEIKIEADKTIEMFSLLRFLKSIVTILLMSGIAIVAGGLIGSFVGLFLLGGFAPAVGTVIGGTCGAMMALLIVYDHTTLNRKQLKIALTQKIKREEEVIKVFEMILSPALQSAQVEPQKLISHIFSKTTDPLLNNRFYEHAKALIMLELANFDMRDLDFFKNRIENLVKIDNKIKSKKTNEAITKRLDIRNLVEIETTLSDVHVENSSSYSSTDAEILSI